jgi:tripartite-type tricarboxylate transporter receptor subunit TctC
LGEAGVPNIVVLDWAGILAPKGMSRQLVNKYFDEIRRILTADTDRERLLAMGLEVIASSPDEFRREIAAEVKRWAKVVKEANIPAQ